jgi:hypothetical protein
MWFWKMSSSFLCIYLLFIWMTIKQLPSLGTLGLHRQVWFMVFNATFNTISIISWRSVLLVEETGVPSENQRPVASYCQTLSHHVVSSIGTDGICSCKSNYHTITTTTTPLHRQTFCAKYSNQHMDVTGQRSIRFV